MWWLWTMMTRQRMEDVWDIIIAMAYFAIPIQLYLLGRSQQKIFLKQNSTNPFLFYTTLFCCFIASCGMTHLGQVYWPSSTCYTKPITAIVSVATAASLLWLTPMFEKLRTHTPLEVMQLLTTSNALVKEGGVCFSMHDENGMFLHYLGNHAIFGNEPPDSVFDVMSKQDRKLCLDGREVKRCQLQCATVVDAVVVPGFASGFMVVSQVPRERPAPAKVVDKKVVSVASVFEKAKSFVKVNVVGTVKDVDSVVVDSDLLVRNVQDLLAGACSNSDETVSLRSERDGDYIKVSVRPTAPPLDLGRLTQDVQSLGGHCGADQNSAWFAFPYPVLRVLVVEDTPSIRAVIVRHLTSHGHLVDQAGDGAVGLDLALATTYDAIVTDVNMPHLDGRAMASAIFASQPDASKRPKVVAVTTDVLTLGQGGPHFDAVLPKPIRKADLLSQVNSAPRLRRATSAPHVGGYEPPCFPVAASAAGRSLDVGLLPC